MLPDLYPYLDDPDADVRAALCDIMGAHGRSGGDRAADAAAQRSRAPNVADRANRAVERLRAARSAPAQ